MPISSETTTPIRQLRALHDSEGLVVYQAYLPAIADAALAAGRFVPPFRLDRMSWIKPSFRWMMYRSGWAAKAGQLRVLAVTIRRGGFDAALARSCSTHHDPDSGESRDAWNLRSAAADVLVQWDPERGPDLAPLPFRTIQVGLRGDALRSYASDWLLGIEDVTARAHELGRLLAGDGADAVAAVAPLEPPYPLPDEAALAVGAG